MLELTNVEETPACQRVTCALARVGDKWSMQVVTRIDRGPKRFNHLKREIGGISQKMLAATLKGLERDGFVIRTVYPTKPISVEYGLTELGREMVVPVRMLGEWVARNLDRIEHARQSYDAKP